MSIRDSITDDTTSAREIRDEIRSYSAAVAFMSVGAKVSAPTGFGLNVFRIHGAVCHYTGALLPAEGADPACAQLYVHDPQEALEYRMQRNPKADVDTMKQLQIEIVDYGPFAEKY